MNIMGNYFFRQLILWFKNIKFLSERLGLARKLILTYAVVLLIPITVFIASYLSNTSSNIKQSAFQNSKQTVQYARMNIDRNIEILERAAQSVIGNMKFIKFLSEKKEYPIGEILDFKSGLLREVQNIQNLNPDINRLRIFLDNPYFMQMTPTIYSEIYIKEDPIWEDIVAREGRTYWVMNQEKEFISSLDDEGESSVTLYREIRYPANKHLGILEVAMNQKTFFGKLDDYQEDKQSFFCFYSAEKRAIDYSTDIKFAEDSSTILKAVENELNNRITADKGHFFADIDDVNMLVVYDYVEKINNYICYFKTTSTYVQQIQSTSRMIIVMGFAVFALLVVISYYITTIILKKMKIILATMRKVEQGAINIDLPVMGKDEIGEIAFHMRKMVGRINGLVNTLDEMERELQKGDNTEEKIREVNELIYQFRIHELNYILLNDNLSEMEIKKILDIIKIEPLQKESKLAVCLAYHETGKEIRDPDIYVHLKDYTQKYIQDNGLSVFCLLDIEKHLVLITNEERALNELADSIEKDLGYEVVIGVSDEIKKVTNIRRAYINAYEALRYRVVPGHGNILFYSELCRLSDEFSVPEEDIRKVQHLVAINDIKKVEEILGDIFDQKNIGKFNISYIDEVVEFIYRDIVQYYMQYIPHKADEYANLESIENFSSVDEYVQELKRFIDEICTLFKAGANGRIGMDVIDTAILYINENYHKDLTMAMVANHVSLNYHYFSTLFNERTGISFVDYLKRIRVEKAKELLKTTNMKVQEVAVNVGYDNPKYFAKVFKKMTGVSPQEFRR